MNYSEHLPECDRCVMRHTHRTGSSVITSSHEPTCPLQSEETKP